jgi:pyroglutamyl-peptidase
MTTVITGFGPFEAWNRNASELAVRRLEALALPSVVTEVLPVSYARAAERVADLLERHHPSTLILLGLAASADCLRLERLARNRDDSARPDMDGAAGDARSIVAGAPDTYPSTLPLAAMASAATELGAGVEYSNDAGGYVCNHTFFVAQHLTASRFPACRSGFVHVPDWSEDPTELERLVVILKRWHEHG